MCIRDRANIIVQIIVNINGNVSQNGVNFVTQFGKAYENQFGQQYMFEKGLKKFGNCGKLAAEKELDQLHKRGCLRPIDVSTKSEEEKRKTQKGMLLLTEKTMQKRL